MHTKNFYLPFIITLCILLMASCESHEKKADDAFERVKELRNDTNLKQVKTSTLPSNEITTTKQTLKLIQAQSIDEWTSFKTETELKIKSNESKIHVLKSKKVKPANKGKFDKQIVKLELINNDLRTRLNDYHEEVNLKWQKFKTGINHDIDEIDIAIKELDIDNSIH